MTICSFFVIILLIIHSYKWISIHEELRQPSISYFQNISPVFLNIISLLCTLDEGSFKLAVPALNFQVYIHKGLISTLHFIFYKIFHTSRRQHYSYNSKYELRTESIKRYMLSARSLSKKN